MEEPDKRSSVTVGRYLLHRQIARGGMATIHIARLMGDEGFSRIVAAKRLLPEFAEDTDFVAMFMDEARIASKVHHPNVVPVLDLVTTTDEVMLVQEYVHGVPLHILLRTAHEAGKKIPVKIAVSIAAQVLAGLHAAHTTLDEMGAPLDIVHRDVSPQNVMIALDGSARLLDFGVAKATMGAHITREGTFKGKLAYSAPEQVRGKPVQQSDIYALAVVLWELVVGHRMHGAQGEAELVATIMAGNIPPITDALANEADWGSIDSEEWKLLSAIEPIVERGLEVDLAKRYATAQDMESDLRQAVIPATSPEVAAWVKSIGKDFIESRDKVIAAEEQSWRKAAPQLSTSVRRTPIPGELRRPTTISEVSAPQLPSAPSAKSPRMIIGVLGALVLLLGVGVVFAHQSNGSVRHDAEAAPAPSPVEQPKPVSAPPVVVEAPPPPPAVTPPVVVETQPAQTATDAAQQAQQQPAPAQTPTTEIPPPEGMAAEKPVVTQAPVRRFGVRPTPRLIKKVVDKEPAKPTAPVQAAAPAPPAVDCSTPYYFEGQKKIFKPECL